MKSPLIPDHWSAQEALAVFEFIDEIREAIWCRYGLSISEQLQAERSTPPEDWAKREWERTGQSGDEEQSGDVPPF